MKVLILGSNGMLGHKLLQKLSTDFEVIGTIRGELADFPMKISNQIKILTNISALEINKIDTYLKSIKPDVLINCIGVIKHRKTGKDPIECITINSLFPHQLAKVCNENNVRLIHFSTDCVFSGSKGPYIESDPSDAEDWYGKSKYLGEVDGAGTLIVRTSIIGRELSEKSSLVEWFLSQKGREVKGFAKALYTGLTTNAMADLISMILRDFPSLSGLYHVSSESISKFELLNIINKIYGLDISLIKDENFFCDRRLDSGKFRSITGYQPLSWEVMVQNMYEESI